MAEHNVEVRQAANGDYWIPLAQPYAKFVTEMMEPQRYPEVRLQPGRDILRPYDVASWTLPLQMGVKVERGPMPDRRDDSRDRDQAGDEGGHRARREARAQAASRPRTSRGRHRWMKAGRAGCSTPTALLPKTLSPQEVPEGTLAYDALILPDIPKKSSPPAAGSRPKARCGTKKRCRPNIAAPSDKTGAEALRKFVEAAER